MNFYDVIRRASPSSWETMSGDARTAMDSRMAAEVLDRFADEVEGKEVLSAPPPPPPTSPLSMQRLGERSRSLDSVLSQLHLSPHPPLVVAIEGATEMLILPRVMRRLGMRIDPTWIRMVNFEGTKELSLLARFAAEPMLGDDRGSYVMLDRPVTRFLVLTDAENKFATAADRRRQRKLLLDSITAGLPKDLRGDLYTRGPNGARIVEIMTWGKLPFEFAHFTDNQLADGLITLAASGPPGGRSGLIHRIDHQRTVDASPNITDAWPRSGVGKVALAEAMWPLLEARIERAIARRTAGPPVMKAAASCIRSGDALIPAEYVRASARSGAAALAPLPLKALGHRMTTSLPCSQLALTPGRHSSGSVAAIDSRGKQGIKLAGPAPQLVLVPIYHCRAVHTWVLPRSSDRSQKV